ncbi:MAG: hypothetical protein V6Z86_09075 [Hyphomicrobiales bacterium]
MNNSRGLAAVCPELSDRFLSLRDPPEADESVNDERRSYIALLECFNLLCNLNKRDASRAGQLIAGLWNSPFGRKFCEMTKALSHWSSGETTAARTCFQGHLQEHDSDFVAVFMLHMFDFLHGRPNLYGEYLQPGDLCLDPEFGGYYQGILAFAQCEQGLADRGLAHAEKACAINIGDVYAVHALVHCYHAMGKHAETIRFLSENLPHWKANPGMNIHVYWHLALSYLEMGQLQEALDAYRAFWSLRDGDEAEQDLDAANFCLRVSLHDPSHSPLEGYHGQLAKNWAPSIDNSLSYFNDAHAAIAFLLSGNDGLMEKLLSKPSMTHLDRKTNETGVYIIQAIGHFMNKHYTACARLLTKTRSTWHLIGGSIPQREILELILNASVVKI